MNPRSVGEAIKLARGVSSGIWDQKKVTIVLAPPFLYTQVISEPIKKSSIKLGAQNVFWEKAGAYTGEISAEQLKSSGAAFVILGHSERRALGETNSEVRNKLKAVVRSGMKAILCVGEKEKRHDEAFPRMVKEELTEALSKIKKQFFKNIILAYEPIWAIGTGQHDTPEDVFEMSILIRKEILKLVGKKWAFRIPILYGGSVDEKNAADFIKNGRVDGLLVGGASLNAKKFVKIVEAVSHS